MIRNILAVIVGFAIWTALWFAANAVLRTALPEAFDADGGINESSLLVLILFVSVLCSLLSGFTTASISTRNEMKPLWVLAVIQVAIGTVVEVAYWSVIPVWYHITFILLLAPAIIAGGKLAMARKIRGSALT